jgi:hypothetical protein
MICNAVPPSGSRAIRCDDRRNFARTAPVFQGDANGGSHVLAPEVDRVMDPDA